MVGQLHMGIAGWSYDDWNGIVYPTGKLDKLAYVAQSVDVIEINSTFYRPPNGRNSKSWLERTRQFDDFYFTAKLHREFTHDGRIEAQTVREFHDGFEPLLAAGKLRQLLVQFRYDFAENQHTRRHLTKIVREFSDSFSIVVEVRHRSWQQEEGLSFLGDLGVSVCNLDYPVSSNSFDMEACTLGSNGYFRMHGRNTKAWFSKAGRDETYNYCYDRDELGQIEGRLEKLRKAFESVTVIGNNHYRGAELANALELKAMVTGEKVPVPEGLMREYPRLNDIAANAGLF